MLPNYIIKYQRHLVTSYRSVHLTLNPVLAGHSKWANIKHIKAQKDGEKAVQFTRLSRQIRLAVQEGGHTDPSLNSLLKTVVEEALRKNMPMSTIQNNIQKSQQSKDKLKKYRLSLRYKQKVFALCILYTDNFPGFKMDMAPIVKKAGAVFADIDHMFDDFGLIQAIAPKDLPKSVDLEEKAIEDAIECGAEEVETNAHKAIVNFICSSDQLNTIQKAVEARGYIIEHSEHVFFAKKLVQLTPDEHEAYDAFVRKLRDLPGLEDIYDNVELD